jgi:hypothetical protein
MMRISGYSFSIAVSLLMIPVLSSGQDTVNFPLRFGIGAALYSPVAALADLYPRGVEINGYYDFNEKITFAAEGGYSRFTHNIYNYAYENSGAYLRAGIDYNLLNPVLAAGKYYTGVSLRYGFSLYNHTTPEMEYTGYWGVFNSSAPRETNTGHFLEISPGVRAELFKNVFIGWAVNIRLLLWSSTGDNLRAVDIPGFGNGSRAVSSGFNYYISIRIPYKTKQVIYTKPQRDAEETGTGTGNR